MVCCGYMAVRERATLKQQRFARAYVEEANATEAVFKAGYKVKKRSTAQAMASENLAKPIVQAEIESWQAILERSIAPSLQTIDELRRDCPDPRVRLAASRDLLNRAGVGKQNDAPRSVVAVFANMDEGALLDKMAQLAGLKQANPSEKTNDVSYITECATQEGGAVGTGVRLPASSEEISSL